MPWILPGRFADKPERPFEACYRDVFPGNIEQEGKVEQLSRPGDAVIRGEQLDQVAIPRGNVDGVFVKLYLERLSRQFAVVQFPPRGKLVDLQPKAVCDGEPCVSVGEDGACFEKSQALFPADVSR